MGDFSAVKRALKITKRIGTRYDCVKFRNKIFIRHEPVCLILANEYKKIAKKKGYVEANRWLRSAAEALFYTPRLAVHDDQTVVEEVCGFILDGVGQAVGNYRYSSTHTERQVMQIYTLVETQLSRLQILPSSSRKSIEKDHKKIEGVVKRALDPQWLYRRVQQELDKHLEQFYREHGQVQKVKSPYVSQYSLKRIERRDSRNALSLESMEAVNELGDRFTLAELAAKSSSNPVVRVAELNAMMRGIEDYAKLGERPTSAYFLTLTCPSKYHLRRKNGSRIAQSINATPREAQDYLSAVWARIRARLKDRDIESFGIRVAEAHHDGTPHWHILVWFEEGRAEEALALCKKYALAEDGDEKGAEEARFDAKYIDPEKGSATGYIVKYISKNITGEHIDSDDIGVDGATSAKSVSAWARLWGFRQFDFFGVPAKGVYQELRRLKSDDYDGFIAKIIDAADRSDFCEYIRLMGGTNTPKNERPLSLYKEHRKTLNKYGEVVETLKGVLHGCVVLISRIHEWTLERVSKPRLFPRAACNDMGNAPGNSSGNDDNVIRANRVGPGNQSGEGPGNDPGNSSQKRLDPSSGPDNYSGGDVATKCGKSSSGSGILSDFEFERASAI